MEVKVGKNQIIKLKKKIKSKIKQLEILKKIQETNWKNNSTKFQIWDVKLE